MGRMRRTVITFRSQAILSIAAAMILVPARLVLAWLMAAVVHEGFHVVAVFLFGGKLHSVCIGPMGATINASLLYPAAEAICALAGPLGSCSLMCFSGKFPELALCALIQSGYNLLPLPQLDGGHALHAILGLMFSDQMTQKLCAAIEYMTLGTLFFMAIFGAFVLKLGWFPVFAVVIIALRSEGRKIPCKHCLLGVQ